MPMRFFPWLVSIFYGWCALPLHAQLLPDANTFVLGSSPTATLQSTSTGAGVGPHYPLANSYTLNFGEDSSASVAQATHILSFTRNGLSFVRPQAANVPPYAEVRLQRVVGAQSQVQSLDRFTGLFAQGSSMVGAGSARPPGALYYAAEYTASMPATINSTALNRGTDNVFTNFSTETSNNIERVDLLFSNTPGAPRVYGANPTVLLQNGVLITERSAGSGDPFAVAAITGINAAGQVTQLGPLRPVPASFSWRSIAPAGGSAVSYWSTVFLSAATAGGDTTPKPGVDVGQQEIRALYLPLAELGLQPDANGQVQIYGLALFAGDVYGNLSTALRDNPTEALSDAPSSTPGKSWLQLLMTETTPNLLQTNSTNGGLDLMGGGGIFSATQNIALVAGDDDLGLLGQATVQRNLGALSAILGNDTVDSATAVGQHVRIRPTWPQGSPFSLNASDELVMAANTPPDTYTFTYFNELLSGPANDPASHVLTQVDGTPFRSNVATVVLQVSALTADDDDLGTWAFSAQARTVGTLASLLDGDAWNGAAIAPPVLVRLNATLPAGSPLTWDANVGQVTLAAGAPAGDYTFTYTLTRLDAAGAADLLDAANQPIVSNAATVTLRVLAAQPPHPPHPQPPNPPPGNTVAIPVVQGWVLPLLGSWIGLAAFWRRRYWR